MPESEKKHIKTYQNISGFYLKKGLNSIKKGIIYGKRLIFAYAVIFA